MRTLIATMLCGALLASGAGAQTRPDPERAHDYEDVFRASCTASASTEACECALRTLERRLGAQTVATEVARDRDAFAHPTPLADLSAYLIGSCDSGRPTGE